MKRFVLCVLGVIVTLVASFHLGLGDHIASFGERIAGFSLADWALIGGVGLLVVSMVLYRIFVGPPVLTEEEEKEWQKEEKEWEEWHERWFNNPGNPASPLYSPWEDLWEK